MSQGQLYALFFVVATFAVLLFAARVGGRAERWGSGVMLLAILLTWTVQAFFGVVEAAKLAIDMGLAIALAVMLFRWKLFWLGISGCAQTLLLAFTASRFVGFPLSETAYVYALNFSSWGLLGGLFYGACEHRWGRKDEYAELLAATEPARTA